MKVPDYFDLKNYHGVDVAKPVPIGWRRCLQRFPYFTGQRVRLRLRFKKAQKENRELVDFVVRQKLTHIPEIVEYSLKHKSYQGDEFNGVVETDNRISLSGDIAFYFALRHQHGEPIFTAHVFHMDAFRWGLFFFLFGLFAGSLPALIQWATTAGK